MEREPHKYAELVASDLPVEGPIEEDIPRTMYDHELFCRKSRVNGRDMLRRVLTAYGRYDRQVVETGEAWPTAVGVRRRAITSGSCLLLLLGNTH